MTAEEVDEDFDFEETMRAIQNTNDVRGKQKNTRQIIQMLNSTYIDGEKIAKENQ